MAVDQTGILAVVRQRIALRQLKTGSVEWHGACPFCSSKDDGFMCWSNTGNYYCRKCDAKGFSTQFVMKTQGKTWKQAQAILGITSSSNGKHPVTSSEIAYHSRAHYAAVLGVPESVLIKARFQKVEVYQGRPAMKYVTHEKDGKEWWRVRFMDGKKPKYKPVKTGTPDVWYRLHNQALGMSNKSQKPIVIVNGETGVLAAQHYGIPATCKTGGEAALPTHLLEELQVAYANNRPREILIALDCDKAGRTAAKSIEAQLIEGKWKPTIIDLGFADTGDMANFCQLYTQDSAKQLETLVEGSKPLSYNARAASKALTESILSDKPLPGKILLMPFKPLHALGGDARFMKPKRITIIGSMTGHYKTAFVETMIDAWLPLGINGIMDGQEFEDKDYALRRVLRFSGRKLPSFDKPGSSVVLTPITYDEITSHQMFRQEERDKVSLALRQGENIFEGKAAEGKRASVAYVDKMTHMWAGHLEYVPPGIMFIEDKIVFMSQYIEAQRASGKSVDFAVFDYVQLMFCKDNTGQIHNYQYAIGIMKKFAIEMNIHVIAVSQVNKQPSKDAKANNKRLVAPDLAYINDTDANLTLLLNFYYVSKMIDGNEAKDFNGDTIIEHKRLPSGHNAAVVDVVKNSHGPPGPVQMPIDVRHIRWVNTTWGV